MALLSQTMGEIGEIVFRSRLFDEKHMLEAASYLSFAVCGFGGLPRHAAQSVPHFAIIPLSVETGFLTWNTWTASVSSTAKKTLLVLWKPPKRVPFLLSLSRGPHYGCGLRQTDSCPHRNTRWWCTCLFLKLMSRINSASPNVFFLHYHYKSAF